MIESRIEAWNKIKKLDISEDKKQLVFECLFEKYIFDLLEKKKNKSKLFKNTVKFLIENDLTVQDIEKVLIMNTDNKKYLDLHFIGCYNTNYKLYLKKV